MSEHIDKIFREKLAKHQAPVPNGLWESIAADQAAKRRAGQWRAATKYAVLLVLLLGGLTFLYLSQSNTEAVATAENTLTKSVPELQADTETNSRSTQEITTTEKAGLSTEQNAVSEAPSRVNQANDASKARSASDQINASVPESNAVVQSNFSEETTTATKVDEQEAENTSSRQLVAVDPMLTLPLPLLSPYRAEVVAPEMVPPNERKTTEGFRKQQRQKFTFDLLAGPAYANQIFKLSDENDRALLNSREISEFPSVSLLAGFRVAYQLKGRWSLRSGLLFTQIRNQFEFEQIPIDPMETPLLIRSSNRIRLLEIPLLATYELPGKRFRLALNAGPVLNLSTVAKGRHLMPDLQQPINLEEENIYRTRVGISYQLSLTAVYQLGQGNSLLIEPTFRSYRSSFTQDDYALSERYWLAGIQFGLRHRLR